MRKLNTSVFGEFSFLKEIFNRLRFTIINEIIPDQHMDTSYFEPQWTPSTKLISQIVQVFNIEGNEDLVKAYQQADANSIANVLLEAINRRSAEMGQEWVNEARKLVLSDQLFPALRETMTVLENI